MSKPTSLAARHWGRILRRWPVDRLRPEWVSVKTVMQKRLDHRLNPSTTSQLASEASAATKAKGAAPVTQQPAPVWNEAKELEQANVLYSLLENRYMNEYPMPETLRYPQSRPTHYDDIVREFAEEPDRTWFQRLVLRLKGSIRMQ